jgi:hypothetical protein
MFSILTPLDLGRFEQFENTKHAYDKMEYEKEFVIPTRNYERVAKYLGDRELSKNVRLIPYGHETGFNVSKALNLGVKNAKYDQVIITSPEVIPLTPVLDQFASLLGRNVIAQVFDQEADGTTGMSLVNRNFRGDTPAMYFLAMFNKKDIYKINGWDENFMNGYAYEDNDFGDRWMRAGLPFELHEEIQALHQYHPRGETISGGLGINHNLYQENNAAGVIRCLNGIVKLTETEQT